MKVFQSRPPCRVLWPGVPCSPGFSAKHRASSSAALLCFLSGKVKTPNCIIQPLGNFKVSDVTPVVVLGACRSRVSPVRNCVLAAAGRGCGLFFHRLSQSGTLQAAGGLWLGSGPPPPPPPHWLDHLWRRRVTTGSSRRNLGLLGGASCAAADVRPNSGQKQSFIVFVGRRAKQSSLGRHR